MKILHNIDIVLTREGLTSHSKLAYFSPIMQFFWILLVCCSQTHTFCSTSSWDILNQNSHFPNFRYSQISFVMVPHDIFVLWRVRKGSPEQLQFKWPILSLSNGNFDDIEEFPPWEAMQTPIVHYLPVFNWSSINFKSCSFCSFSFWCFPFIFFQVIARTRKVGKCAERIQRINSKMSM